ncbi:lantibiotic dehydratase [Streptomyces sp. NPDC001407]|uniref:lantibiotic dehydratase n=1 Tax=Streptomyces sp. NPDC001407 TaxID=3364573 RepID=UPI0036CBFC2C
MTAAPEGADALDVQDTAVPGTEHAFAMFFGGDDDTVAKAPPVPSGRGARALRFRSDQSLLVRAVHHAVDPAPALPDGEGLASQDGSSWRTWISATWKNQDLADAVRLAAPGFASEIDALLRTPSPETADVGKAGLSLAAYCLRMRRPTPRGLFAGITKGSFGDRSTARWGERHRAVAQADGVWMAEVVALLEAIPAVRERLLLTANNMVLARGERLVVPWQPRTPGATTTTVREVSVRYTPLVRAVVETAEAPVPYRDVLGKVLAQGDASEDSVRQVLDELIVCRVLISNLHPTSTTPDPLGYLVAQLGRCGIDRVDEAAGLVAGLREIHRLVGEHNQLPAAHGSARRAALLTRMRDLSEAEPLQVDMHLDGEVVVPRAVAWEVESAVAALARVSPEPYGTAPWRAYRERFLGRYGPGVLVPLTDLLDPATGLGLPEDFLGGVPAARPAVSRRDKQLLRLAHQALAEGRDLELDDATTEALAAGDPVRMEVPPHTEVLIEVHSPSEQALDAGDFRAVVRGLSRGLGYFTGGRFAGLLAASSSSRLSAALADRPARTEGAAPVQLVFPALRPSATSLIRTPELLPDLISLSEYREPRPGTTLWPVHDLAVTCDGHRLHLVSRARRQVLEPSFPHPLQIEYQTPAIARFLDELVRGQTARITGPPGTLMPFDWGAAGHLPALPRLRHGRTVLSPRTWHWNRNDLPDHSTGTARWQEDFTALRDRRDIPAQVFLTLYDMRLPLDLEDPAHLELLRHELERQQPGPLAFVEAPTDDAFGWCGGRPTELAVLLRSAAPASPAPRLQDAPVIPRGHGRLPGAGPYLCARLYGPSQDRAELVSRHLPDLLSRLGTCRWWYRPHGTGTTTACLELYLRADGGDDEAAPIRVMQQLGTWAQHLTETGVLSDFAFVPYRPHTGLWGEGPLLRAAEECFAADSGVVARLLARPAALDSRILAAAHMLDIAAGLCGGIVAGARWFDGQPKPVLPMKLPVRLREQATRHLVPAAVPPEMAPRAGIGWLTGPRGTRPRALTGYRELLATGGRPTGAVVRALLHEHYLRTLGDPAHEPVALHLARAAAHTYLARHGAARGSQAPC